MINEEIDQSQLRSLIEEFYHILSINYWKFSHRIFPMSCCEETSIVLNRFLKRHNIHCFKLIMGRTLEDDIHFWLESKKYVIDLTAHQHEGIKEPYLLIKKEAYPLFELYSYDIEESQERLNTEYIIPFVRDFEKFIDQAYSTKTK